MSEILVAPFAPGPVVRPQFDAAGARSPTHDKAGSIEGAAGRTGRTGAPAQGPPAVTIHTAGAQLEALVWRPVATDAEGEPVVLRGPVIVAPAPQGRGELSAAGAMRGTAGGAAVGEVSSSPDAAGSASGRGSMQGGRLATHSMAATIVGPVGPDALLAEADGLFLVLRGATLHLPTGARVIVAWRGRPEAHPGMAFRASAGASASRFSLGPTVSGLAAGAAVAERSIATDGSGGAPVGSSTDIAAEAAAADRTNTGGKGAPSAEPASLAAPAQAADQAGPAVSSLAELVERLARRLGLPVVDADERNGRRGETIERGAAAVMFDFPALGRIRLECAWSAQGIEVRVVGLPALADRDRAELLGAFADGLTVAGVRGRVVLVERSGP